MRKPEHSRKFHLIVEKAIAITRVREARCVVVSEQIIWELYPKPTPAQMELISIHLKAIAMIRSHQGSDSTLEEKHQFLTVERYHHWEIKIINEGYYQTIKIQSHEY